MPGRDHPAWHTVATDRAELLVLANRIAEAHALYARILELEDKTRSATLPQTQRARAELALVEHNWPEAADYSTRSIAGYETAGGANNPELWRPLAVLGRAQLELGKLDLAKVTLARALAIATAIQLPARDLAPIEALQKRL